MTLVRPQAEIAGTGHYVPACRIDNAQMERRLGEPVDAWLRENVGIEARHVMSADQATSDLVVIAATRALERAGCSPSEVDLVIVATDTPDYLSPATASVVAHRLGAARAGVFDLNAACAGWVTALDLAARYVQTDPQMGRVLVCGGYGMTRYLDWSDKKTATLFADGAGAALVRRSSRPGFIAGRLEADGQYHDALGIYTGGTRRPATLEVVSDSGPPTVQFVRKFPATFNSERWPPLLEKTLAKGGLVPSDVDLFIFTQLNARTIEAVMDRLGAPMSKTHMVMDKWGYLGSACIPAAFDDALSRRELGPGSVVAFCATGGGLAMACSVWRWWGGGPIDRGEVLM